MNEEVACPYCGKKISRLLVSYNGKPSHGYCPLCKHDLTKEQADSLNNEVMQIRWQNRFGGDEKV